MCFDVWQLSKGPVDFAYGSVDEASGGDDTLISWGAQNRRHTASPTLRQGNQIYYIST